MTNEEVEVEEGQEPLATFEAAFLPDWKWTVLDVEERAVDVVVGMTDAGEPETRVTDVYYGYVESPNTYGSKEYGTFSAHELRQAGAFRTDRDTGEWP